MKILMPIGVVLVAVGMAGSAASCYGNAIFDGAGTQTAAQMSGTTDAPANQTKDSSPRLFLRALSRPDARRWPGVRRRRNGQLAPSDPL